MSRIRIRISLVAVAVAVVVALAGSVSTAGAQVVTDYVAELRQYDVSYDQGAFGMPAQEGQADAAAARLQEPGAFFKVVILEAPVTSYASPRDFAQAVLDRLGGTGRVLVFEGLDSTGIASNAGDSTATIERAEAAAAADTSASGRWADGVATAGDQLGIAESGSGSGSGSGTDAGSSSGGGGGAGILIVVVVLAVLVIGGFLLYRMVKKPKGGAAGSTVSLGEGEMKVRQQVDRAGNLVLELADRVEMAGAPPEAKTAFQQGATEFADLQDDLEEADTHEELEAVYPKIVDSVWKLESAKALTEGQPVPPKPDPGLLFPPPPAPPPGAPSAGPDPLGPVDAPRGYRGSSMSPWLTTAATAALSMLASRAMAPSNRNYRPPASDDFFFGGGSSSGGSSGRGVRRRSGGSSSGGSGRGVKRRS